jgi:hypothetical protein
MLGLIQNLKNKRFGSYAGVIFVFLSGCAAPDYKSAPTDSSRIRFTLNGIGTMNVQKYPEADCLGPKDKAAAFIARLYGSDMAPIDHLNQSFNKPTKLGIPLHTGYREEQYAEINVPPEKPFVVGVMWTKSKGNQYFVSYSRYFKVTPQPDQSYEITIDGDEALETHVSKITTGTEYYERVAAPNIAVEIPGCH